MDPTPFQGILTDLLQKVAGLRGAILVDQEGMTIAQAGRESGPDLEAAGAGAGLLLRETLAAAERLGQGEIGEILIEGERMTVAVMPLKSTCSLCVLLGPEAVVGRSLFEARRAAFALDQAL